MKYLFATLIFIHGAIHLMGFLKAFNLAQLEQMNAGISKISGIVWLLVFVLFMAIGIAFLAKAEWWFWLGIVAAAISTVLIIMVWKDARFGTIANIIIVVVAVLAFGSVRFENQFKKDVNDNLRWTNTLPTEILTATDLQPLPEPVQRYLKYSGVVNKPKVKNVRVVFEGKMREKGKDWFPFTTLQYNFFDEPARLFFMKAKMFGVTVPGYHRYSKATATMDIRLFGLLSVINIAGESMNKTETVTLFNDMCLIAPATLLDKRIEWKAIDSATAEAVFTNRGISIEAVLYFNPAGQLINFTSDDRTAVSDMKQYRFSTPVSEYKTINGSNIMTYGETVWHYPDGEFVYGKFKLKEIKYNVNKLE